VLHTDLIICNKAPKGRSNR